jgi:hypothetical protein
MKRRAFLTRSLGVATAASGLSFAGSACWALTSTAQGHRVLDLDLFDTSRQRPVPARVYLPQRASPSQPVPLVVFSHGLGGSRAGYSYLGRHWADAGIASLHPQHVGSDNRLWQGNPLDLLQRLQIAARESEALGPLPCVRAGGIDRPWEDRSSRSLVWRKHGHAGCRRTGECRHCIRRRTWG